LCNDGVLKVICAAADLEQLSVTNSSVTNAGIENIARLKHLRGLRIGSPQVSDAAIGHLSSIRSLDHLNLLGTSVTQDGIRRLRAALPHCDIPMLLIHPTVSQTKVEWKNLRASESALDRLGILDLAPVLAVWEHAEGIGVQSGWLEKHEGKIVRLYVGCNGQPKSTTFWGTH
jgi:hypothetical protein